MISWDLISMMLLVVKGLVEDLKVCPSWCMSVVRVCACVYRCVLCMYVCLKNISVNNNHTMQVTLAQRICSTCSLEAGVDSQPSVWEEVVEIPLPVSTVGEMYGMNCAVVF